MILIMNWRLPAFPRPVFLSILLSAAALFLAGCGGGPEIRGFHQEDPFSLGPFPLYREYHDGRRWRPLEPGKDLYLEVWYEMGRSGKMVNFTFSKLSSREKTGPRLLENRELVVSADETELKFEAGGGILSIHPHYYFEQAWADIPLPRFERIARAGAVRGKIGGLSEFSFSPGELGWFRELARRIRSPGPDRRAMYLPRKSGVTLFTLADGMPDQGPPSRTVLLTAHYSGRHPGPEAGDASSAEPSPMLLPTGWIEYPRERPEGPLVGRMVEREGPVVFREPFPGEADAALAREIAGIVHETIQEELSLKDPPGLFIILFPVAGPDPVRISVPVPVGKGMALGIPSVQGRLLPAHAVRLCLLAHEYVECFLANPHAGNDSFLYGDPRNRWIGEGLASVVMIRAARNIRKRGFDLPPVGSLDRIVEEWKRGRRTIRLVDWLPEDPDVGQYSAAEYLASRWSEKARERGHDRPIAELAAWLKDNRGGAQNARVLEWMNRAAGMDLAREAGAVSLEKALRHQERSWKVCGWEIPLEARRILDGPGKESGRR